MITISQDDEMDVTEEEELTLLAQDTNHQIRDELGKTVDELEEEVREEIKKWIENISMQNKDSWNKRGRRN